MEGCESEEESEVPVVSLGYTCSHPWTVVVMNFNASATLTAVEGPGRSEDLAGIAELKLHSMWVFVVVEELSSLRISIG